jgi:hypothetical protein
VSYNPLKYRDPTGHVKKTPEQEAMERGLIQEEIFQSSIFKRLGTLESSSRIRALGESDSKRSNRKIEQLRHTSEIGIKKVKQMTG